MPPVKIPHKHKFVPVDVLWLRLWSALNEGKKPKAGFVVLACECGTVKVVQAKGLNAKKMVEWYE